MVRHHLSTRTYCPRERAAQSRQTERSNDHGLELLYRFRAAGSTYTTRVLPSSSHRCHSRAAPHRLCGLPRRDPVRRGWELDKMIAAASARGYGDVESLRPIVADLMLRFSLFQRDVDRVIIGMRKVEWIKRNVESVSKGPLTADEYRWLQRLRAFTLTKQPWWHRIRRLF